eukprot:scaffold87648_cov28-Tisochrysis_lutea.AAC.1
MYKTHNSFAHSAFGHLPLVFANCFDTESKSNMGGTDKSPRCEGENLHTETANFTAEEEWNDIVDDTAFSVRTSLKHPSKPRNPSSLNAFWSQLRHIWVVLVSLFLKLKLHPEQLHPPNTHTAFISHSPTPKKLDFIIDCGATKHCISNELELDRVTDDDPQTFIIIGDGRRVPVSKIGDMTVIVDARLQIGEEKYVQRRVPVRLTGVRVVPSLAARLFSCRAGYENDNISTFLNKECYLQLPGGEIAHMAASGHHYVLNFETALTVTTLGEQETDDATPSLWHARLGHFNVHRIRSAMLSRGKKDGHASADKLSCKACAANQRRSPHKAIKTQSRTYAHFGERIVSDTCGPFPPSPSGLRFAIIFVDMFSRFASVYFLKSKSSADVLIAAQTFVGDHAYLLNKTSIPGVVDQWDTDNGMGHR